MEEFVVYVLYSESANRLYIGYSSNSIERFKWHNGLSRKGHTVRYRPWKMIYVEFFDNKDFAMARERALKQGQGRQWIRSELIPLMCKLGFISA